MRGWKLVGVSLAMGTLVLTGCGDGEKSSDDKTPGSSSSASALSGFPRAGSQQYATPKALADDLKAGGEECSQFTESTSAGSATGEQSAMCMPSTPDAPFVTLFTYSSPAATQKGLDSAGSFGGNYYVYGSGNWIVSCPELTMGSKSACDAVQKVVGGTVYKFP